MLKRYQVYQTLPDGRLLAYIGHCDAENGREALRTVLEDKTGMRIASFTRGNRCFANYSWGAAVFPKPFRAMAVR